MTFTLLNTKKQWGSFLQIKMTSWAYWVGCMLKILFRWKVQLSIISKFLLRSFGEVFLSWIIENIDLSSTNNCTLVESSTERSSTKIKNNNDSRIEPWGTPTVTFFNVETWPLRTMHCFVSLKRLHKSLSKFLDILFWNNLKIICGAKFCQMISRCQGKHL